EVLEPMQKLLTLFVRRTASGDMIDDENGVARALRLPTCQVPDSWPYPEAIHVVGRDELIPRCPDKSGEKSQRPAVHVEIPCLQRVAEVFQDLEAGLIWVKRGNRRNQRPEPGLGGKVKSWPASMNMDSPGGKPAPGARGDVPPRKPPL